MKRFVQHYMRYGRKTDSEKTVHMQESFFKRFSRSNAFVFPLLTMKNQRKKNESLFTIKQLDSFSSMFAYNNSSPARWSILHRSLHNSFATNLGPAVEKTASFYQSLNVSKHKLNPTYLSKACMVPHVTFELTAE